MNKRKVPKIRFEGFHDDWEQRKLGYLAELVGGGTPSTSIDLYWDGEIDWYAPAEIGNQIYLESSQRKITEEGLNKSSAKMLPVGTVLFTSRAGIGKTAILQKEGCTNQGFQSIVPNKERLDSYFIFTRSEELKRYGETVGAGSTFVEVSGKQMANMELMMPTTMQEQQKIGAYFSKIDDLITLHQKKCFEWKKRGFSSDSISWEQRKLIDLLDQPITDGPHETPNIVDDGIPFISADAIVDNKIDFTRKRGNITEEYDLQCCKKYKPEFHDVYLVKSGSTVGKVAIVETTQRFNIWSPLAAMRCKENSDPYFLFALLQTKENQAQVKDKASNGTQPNLSMRALEQFDIVSPYSRNEQIKIGEFFNNLDHLITLHQRKLERLKRLRNSLVDRCFTGEKITMSKLILYHGSPNRVIVPKFGFGEDRHDYGRGFYLTENLELAKEWAVCRPDETNGWVHKYELELDGLNILDFQKYDVLSWLAELMKHRDAADSRRYKMLAQKFIEKYGIDTCGYDVITGWRANASYFYIAKEFVRDNIDIEILEELLSLGGLGIQFCIKSERAFAQLSEVEQDIMSVDYSEFNDRYNERDINARNKMRALVDSDANKVTHVFSTLFER